jgi:hypothetical protein
MGLLERIIERLFPPLPEEETSGMALDMTECWEIGKGKKNCRLFFRELPKLFPTGTTLCIEGTSIAHDIKSFLETHRVTEITKVRLGTLWPRPSVYHVPCEEQTLSGLIELSERHAEPEICDHIYVYRGLEVLLEFNDAFSERLYISNKVPEDKVRAFCAALGCSYHQYKESDTHPPDEF